MPPFHRLLIGLTLLCLPPAARPQEAARAPRLQIQNGSKEPIEVFWLRSDNERVSQGTIQPAKDKILTTTIGHRFAIVSKATPTETVITSRVLVQGFRFETAAPDGIPAFYTQRIEAHGFPIVASAKVNAFALREAAYLVDRMLANRPDVRTAIIASGARLCIMAHNEFTTELPEFERMANGRAPDPTMRGLTAKDYWDARARGTGGSATDPFCTCAEENLLGYPGDPYATECILIHEFAHSIHLRGMSNVDPSFDQRLRATYDAAMQRGLFAGKYASVNHHEYFAEGVQSWFDNNREDDHDHNHVNTRAELLAYDPGLAAMCREVFGDTSLKYSKPATRLTGHMAGYDPSQAPRFEWPQRLRSAKEQIFKAARLRSEQAKAASK
jgi:hypothetical protein